MTRLCILSASVLLLLPLGFSCAPTAPLEDCGISLCGCWEPVMLSYEAVAWDLQTEAPVEGVEVRCAGSDELMAVSDEAGEVSFSLETEYSPGCGYLDCNNLDLTPPEGSAYVDETVATEGTNGGQLVMNYGDD